MVLKSIFRKNQGITVLNKATDDRQLYEIKS